MLRLIIYFLLSVGLLVWLSHNTGVMHIDWLGYQVDIELIFLIPTLILTILTLLQLILFFLKARQAQRGSREISAISNVINGLSCIKTGDLISVNRCIHQAKKTFKNEPILQLLEANSFLMQGNIELAKKSLLKIVNSNSMLKITALNQMLEIAYKENDLFEVEGVINKIMRIFPKEPWALLRLGEFYCNSKQYKKALMLLEKIKKYKLVLNYDINYRISMLNCALAKECYLNQDYNQALKYLNASDRIIGMVILKAQIYYCLNKKKKALSILEDAYIQNPHDDIMKSYVEYGGNADQLPSNVTRDDSSWQCTDCYSKFKAWDYICSKCDKLGTIHWL